MPIDKTSCGFINGSYCLMQRIVLLLILVLGLLPKTWAEVQAVQINQGNLQQRPRGMDAIGGLGDWLLSNGTLCAVISDVRHETGLSASGGWLVDLGYCGRADDQLTYTHLVPMLRNENILPARNIRADSGTNHGRVSVEYRGDALAAKVHYQLSKQSPNQLNITSEVWRIEDGDVIPLISQFWMHPHRSLSPFSVSLSSKKSSSGYRANMTATPDLSALTPEDLTVLVGAADVGPPISYGIQTVKAVRVDKEGNEERLNPFVMSGPYFTAQVWATQPFWLGGKQSLGKLEQIQLALMDLDLGESVRIEQQVTVGQRLDAASVTDSIYQGAWVRGEVNDPAVRMMVYDQSGGPLTDVVPDKEGHFKFRLPKNIEFAQIEVRSHWSDPVLVEINPNNPDSIRYLTLEVRQPGYIKTPKNGPQRLVFKGLGETLDPQFGSDLTGYLLAGKPMPNVAESHSVALLGDDRDPEYIAVPPGHYRIYSSRGLEYSVESIDVKVSRGEHYLPQWNAPKPMVDIDGWISADFHVHSGFSWDSSLSAEQRLKSFIAQGADLLVASEHDNVVDMSAVARREKFDPFITVVTGLEMTGTARAGNAPTTIGHVNAYPLKPQPEQFSGGMPAHEGRRLRRIMGSIRERGEDTLVQLNHPRDASGSSYIDGAYFEHLSIGRRYDSSLPLSDDNNRSLIEPDATTGLRDIDFNILEVLNGPRLADYQLVKADWMALILQGEYRPGVANSDSHGLRDPVAMPRSYVAYAAQRQAPLNTDAVWSALKAGQVFATSGPIPKTSLTRSDGVAIGIGQQISGQQFTLSLSASAAPWVNVDRYRVYLNGDLWREGLLRKEQPIKLAFHVKNDSFIWLEVEGPPSEIYQAIAPGHRPFAFTNPFWIDADGDGLWSPPGLSQKTVE